MLKLEVCFNHFFGGKKSKEFYEGKRKKGYCNFCDGKDISCERYKLYESVEILPLEKKYEQ